MQSARLLTTKNQTVYFRQFDMRTFNRFEGIFSVENVAIDRVIEGGGQVGEFKKLEIFYSLI